METKQEKYLRVTEHVNRVRKLYSKIINSIIVMLIVTGVNYYVNELENPWCLWVIGFSILGIIIETFKVYGTSLFLGKGWEQRKIREHMEKEKNEKSTNTIIRK